MTAVIIVAAVLLLIAALLLLPIKLSVALDGDFTFKAYLGGIKLFDSTKEKKPKPDKAEPTKSEPSPKPQKKKNKVSVWFQNVKAKEGFSGAVKVFFGFAKQLLSRLKNLICHIKFEKIILDITAASDNAAFTAIEYGSICAAVYPVLSFIEAGSKVSYKQINIKSDFNSEKPKFSFSLNIKSAVIFLLISAILVYKDLRTFDERMKEYE